MTFREIYGHRKAIAILQSVIANGRIAHAYLFYGMEGVGKRTTADVFARALNCTAEDPPCDACASCRKAEHKNHPDIVTVAEDGPIIKIATVKELLGQMKFLPREGRMRIFIMPEADRMNPAAANALLKTLEEPSAGNILLLTTARPHALPMTILSRCQLLRFSPLPREEVICFLREKNSVPPEEAAILAASSGGSIGKALEMNREEYITLRNAILDYLVSDDPDDPIGRLAFAARFGTEREDILERLLILKTCYRDALIFRETKEKGRLIFQDRIEAIQAVAGRLSGRDLLRNIAVIEAATGAIDKNANKTLTLETMLIKFA
jgi:DNA polymerase-3 subunit delta'